MEFIRENRVREKVETALTSGLNVNMTFSRTPARPTEGIPEGFCELKLFLGIEPVVHLVVRQHHGKSYSAEKKAAMYATLEGMKAAIEEAITAQYAAIEALPSEPDEAEGTPTKPKKAPK